MAMVALDCTHEMTGDQLFDVVTDDAQELHFDVPVMEEHECGERGEETNSVVHVCSHDGSTDAVGASHGHRAISTQVNCFTQASNLDIMPLLCHAYTSTTGSDHPKCAGVTSLLQKWAGQDSPFRHGTREW